MTKYPQYPNEAWDQEIIKLQRRNAKLVAALQDVLRDIDDYERANSLAPNPGRKECWDSVARAKDLLSERP